MKRIIILSCVFCVCLSSCYFKLTRTQKELNPVEYCFDFSINQVRDSVLSIFCCYKYQKLYFHHGYYDYKKDGVISEAKNINTFFLGSNLTSSGKSLIYYNWWGRLKLFSEYKILIDSVSLNKTRVKITSNVQVKTGLKISRNHLLPYFTAYTQTVEPSTIEEYEILLKIGEALGEKNMPPLKLPKK